jgi:hypothetical protein
VTAPTDARRELAERGFTRLPGVLDAARRERIAERLEELLAEEGERAGSEFRQEPGAPRLANLADKGDLFVACVLEPAVVELVSHVLGPRFKLSSLKLRVTGRAGDVIVMNAHVWHAGSANRTSGRRLALYSFYCRADEPQQQYQKRLLRPGTQARLSPEARAMLALDDPLNDELSAAGEGGSGFLR